MKYYEQFEWIALWEKGIYCPELRISILHDILIPGNEICFKIYHNGDMKSYEAVIKGNSKKSYSEVLKFVKAELKKWDIKFEEYSNKELDNH